jgi:hypothetical protein
MSVATLAAQPVDVACLPAGARLAEELEVLGGNLADADTDRLVGSLPAYERLVGWAQAGQLAVIAEVSRREHDPQNDPVPPGGQRMVPDPRQRVVAEVSTALGVSETTGWRRLELTEALTQRLPEIFDALAAGWLDLVRARVVVDETEKLPEDAARRVAARALTSIPTGTTVSGWRERVRRLVARWDPEALRKPCRLSRADREVYLLQDKDGLATFGALLPEADAGRVFAVVDLVARTALAADPMDRAADSGRRTLKQARADALVDLICNPATLPALPAPSSGSGEATGSTPIPEPVQPPTLLNITVPLAALVDAPGDAAAAPSPPTSETGEIGGIGAVSAAAAREAALTALQGMAGGRVGVRWIGVDEPTGRAFAVTGTTYSPPPLLRAAVQARDRTCRFPGCRRNAERCDLDHVLPYPRGDTSDANLACLCRYHHRLKTHARWRVRRGNHGALIWTSPHGASYLTHPATWTEPDPLHPRLAGSPSSPQTPLEATGPDFPHTWWAELLADWDYAPDHG